MKLLALVLLPLLALAQAPTPRINLNRISPSGGSAGMVPLLSGSPLAWHPAIATPVLSITQLTGDVTAAGPGVVAATLATVNSGPGACGDATHVCQVTVNAKGLATASSPVTINTGFFVPVVASFSLGATTGTITHNFGTSLHTIQCSNVAGVYVFPSSAANGSNVDTVNFLGGLSAATNCVAAL